MALLVVIAAVLFRGTATRQTTTAANEDEVAPSSDDLASSKAENTDNKVDQNRAMPPASSDRGSEPMLPTIATKTSAERAEALRRVDDPRRDGWLTESFTTLADKQLKTIGQYLQSMEDATEPLDVTVAKDFRCTSLTPDSATEVFRDASSNLVVVRGNGTDEYVFQGADGFKQALQTLAAATVTASSEARPTGRPTRVSRAKFKVVRVEADGAEWNTRVRYEGGGATTESSYQQTAHWACRWKWDQDQPPRISQIDLLDFEQSSSQSYNPSLFVDRTTNTLGSESAYRDQLRYGVRHWVDRIEKPVLFDFMGHHGVAVGDANGDGLEDLYLGQSGGLPNRLLIQTEDGTLTDRSIVAGVDFLDYTHGALFLDLDNDGDQDLILATTTALVLLSNDGNAVFTERGQVDQAKFTYSLAAADFDLDGDVDIFSCAYHPHGQWNVGHPVPYHDANNGPANVLVRNDGDWQFTDVSNEVGVGQNNTRWSYAAAWEDFDNDGDPDLYVANDFGRNCLYRNDNGHFTDVAAEAGVEDVASGMSVAWGDYNRDGWMDLYVGNMFSAAGGRITYQRRFKRDAQLSTRSDLQRLARGNTLFENQRDGTFRDVSENAGVTMGRWAWSSPFADINNDGLKDIIIANGHVTGRDAGDL